MKTLGRLGLPGVLVVIVLVAASCGETGGSGGDQSGAENMGHGGSGGDARGGTTGHMAGTDMDKTHGGMKSMNHGGGMASGMVMKGGRYSDEAFIDAMVPHHQGAVEMAQVALKNAEHTEIRQLSRDIISTQRAEINELRSIKREEFGTSKIPMQMGDMETKGMGMMTDPEDLASEKPFDKAFIDAMIPHHQSAIQMARVSSAKTGNPDIRDLAEGIVTAQRGEIEQMENWRQDWYPQG